MRSVVFFIAGLSLFLLAFFFFDHLEALPATLSALLGLVFVARAFLEHRGEAH